MALSKQLGNRLAKMKQAVSGRPRNDEFGVIQAIPLANAGGRSPGLYRVGPQGSTGGAFVYDPANGRPQLPGDIQGMCDLFIVCEPAAFEQGVDYFEWGI